MTTNLYEILGLDRTASAEQIRKAYRKKALQTHPDRQPATITAAEKATAEEQFRLVNNAYEVLHNEETRKVYDRCGVWPPPTEPQATRNGTRRQEPFATYSNPFFSNVHFGPQRPFQFTDPFVLFNSLFSEMTRSPFDEDPFFSDSFSPFPPRSPFDSLMGTRRDPFARSVGFPAFGPGFGGMGGFGSMGGGSVFPDMMNGGNTRSYSSVSQSIGGGNGQWVSQSQMTRSINGRTETITTRRDAEGNEHVTYSSPEGERHTINGIEQPSRAQRAIPPPQARAPPSQAVAPPPQQTNYYTPSPTTAAPYGTYPAGVPPQTQYPTQTVPQPSAVPQAYPTPVPQPPTIPQNARPGDHNQARSRGGNWNSHWGGMTSAYPAQGDDAADRVERRSSRRLREKEGDSSGKKWWRGGW